ncbi:hypothetical protein [Pseudomonas sp. NA-150]|uniref:hypothetical protein n=1 Tax=Pseudomonas sp. NA-150 TaxID=3367525 RepID=UPI0037C91FA1
MNQEIWTPEEQAAFADFMKKQFPNELDSFATMSLGSAWKDGQAHRAPPQPDHSAQHPSCKTCHGQGEVPTGRMNYFGEWQPPECEMATCPECDGQPTNAVQGDVQATTPAIDLDAAAKVMAECLDYPWAHMPEQGRQSMREHAKKVIDAALSANAERTKCESCGDWGHIETEDNAHDCPECGPSVIERAVEAGVMNAPEKTECSRCKTLQAIGNFEFPCKKCGNAVREPIKQKVCIECDQPYCLGVCVERGDEHYDRDHAAKGGDDA